jgi:hypothetical protein
MRLHFKMPMWHMHVFHTMSVQPRRWYGPYWHHHLHATNTLHIDIDNLRSMVPCSMAPCNMARMFIVVMVSGMA